MPMIGLCDRCGALKGSGMVVYRVKVDNFVVNEREPRPEWEKLLCGGCFKQLHELFMPGELVPVVDLG